MTKPKRKRKTGKDTYVIRTVYILEWQDREIRNRNINFSELIRDLLTEFLKGPNYHLVNEDIYFLMKRIKELKEQLTNVEDLTLKQIQEIKKELGKLEEELNQVKETYEAENQYNEDRIVECILKAFEQENYNINNLKKKVKNLKGAINTRLYIKVPKCYGENLPAPIINKIINKREELAFLRPYLRD